MKKKKNKELSAETKADRSTQDQLALSVRRHNTKPDVTCSQSKMSPGMTYDEYAQALKDKSYNILCLLNGLSVEQAKRVLQMVSENLDLSATVDLKPQVL